MDHGAVERARNLLHGMRPRRRPPRPDRPRSRPKRRPFSEPLALLSVLALGATPVDQDGTQPFERRLRPPLAPPLVVTGGFCEYRAGHFHAGLDLGTGQRVGKPVLAPGDGHVARVRASGVGYGRSIYLRIDDGRLLQLGHLDAFAEPLASYVRHQQDSTGQYEQDLWPAPGRFRFRAGQIMAWSGESGAGGPHLHFEIRRGDVAYHPYRAGLDPQDTVAPSLISLTLEPLDETSHVEGGAAPYTRRLSAVPETLSVLGRLRAIVGARDGVWRGVDRMVPWAVGLEWEGRTIECRFDSVSWATDMAQGDYVYDAGRVIGEKGLVLWAPPRFRPVVLRSDQPLSEEAGTLVVRRGDPPRVLRLWARDLGGGRVERRVVLMAAGLLDTARRGGSTPGRSPRLELVSLPGGRLRVTDRGAPAGSEQVRVMLGGGAQVFPASAGSRGFTAVVPFAADRGASPRRETIGIEGVAAGKRWLVATSLLAARIDPDEARELIAGAWRVRVPKGAPFESGVLFVRDGEPIPSGELGGGNASYVVGPERTPLREPVVVSLEWQGGALPRGVGLYRESDGDWDWMGASYDSATRRFSAESRRLGRFALLQDVQPPQVSLRPTPRKAQTRPYSRWAIEASVVERGSGLDARGSYFEVDGRRVATEWDGEERILRWRPARRPVAGSHRLLIVTRDKAGNRGEASLRFRS